ncbi:hypothetical protein DL95DRAFT_30972 [Leptodontidium sp. 2 PMI_412]|nr:hypothetical protein DL95DRAFT_30972 [Leptodontidium sp. 2 PMI_412]
MGLLGGGFGGYRSLKTWDANHNLGNTLFGCGCRVCFCGWAHSLAPYRWRGRENTSERHAMRSWGFRTKPETDVVRYSSTVRPLIGHPRHMCDFSWISEISWNISLTSSSSIKAGLHQLEVRTGDLQASFVQIQHRGELGEIVLSASPALPGPSPYLASVIIRPHTVLGLGQGWGNRKSDLPA